MQHLSGVSHPTPDQLKKMAMLEGLSDEDLNVAANKLYPRHFSAGDLIFTEGSLGDVMYLIEAGRVRLGSDVGLERDTLGVLGPGEHFGEMALLENGRQYAWARADTDVDTWVLYKPDFDDLLARYPPLHANLSKSLSRRLAEADQEVSDGLRSGTGLPIRDFVRESWHVYTDAGYLAMLRMLLGVVFISTAFDNLHKGLYGPGFQSFVESWAVGNPIAFYRTFLEGVVIPNWQIFASVQLIVEPIVMGLFLLIGLFTRASAFVAAFFIANLFLASLGKEWPWTYLVILGVLVALILSRAGRCLGVDQMLAERYPNPRIPLW
ncbi:MAG: DoxX family membrane protein [Chloroflexi bacterium]|nr:MAG: DoxX family membrane protein [Chloroflexota bacterium]